MGRGTLSAPSNSYTTSHSLHDMRASSSEQMDQNFEPCRLAVPSRKAIEPKYRVPGEHIRPENECAGYRKGYVLLRKERFRRAIASSIHGISQYRVGFDGRTRTRYPTV